MTTTTTIRVDTDTHAELQRLSRETGTSLTETVRNATEALRRQRFGRQVAAEFVALRADAEGWAGYLVEFDRSPAGDGID